MDPRHRQRLQRGRLRLVQELRVDPLWDLLVNKGIFTLDMIEEIQRAGTRRDQARQLVTDLQTRGREAFPAFIWCLQETEQSDLAALLSEGCSWPQSSPAEIKPVEVHPGPGRRDETTCSTKENSRRDLETVYMLKRRPCGYCLIINNVTFRRMAPRIGSDLDCQRLQKRFKSLHFDVLTQQDLTAKEIVQELKNLAKRDHSSLDCCLVVILSHGCQTSHIQFPGGIYGTDGKPIPVEKIIGFLNGSSCPSLRGKPKLFFIQACGGEEKDQGFQVENEPSAKQTDGSMVESDAAPSHMLPDEKDTVASLPTPSDILVSYSTFPGFVSWRDKQSGSWYVETLDDILEQYASSEDLLNMLLRVANAVSAKGKYKQMPGCFNFLRKRFFFMASA